MSFDLACEACGAISGPSVGVCPYCKTALSRARGKDAKAPDGTESIRQAYAEGRVEDAVALVNLWEAGKAEPDPAALTLFARVLIEADGPASKIKSFLHRAQLREPANAEAAALFEVIQARSEFTHEGADRGERRLRELLKKSPDFDLALFLLGAHLFWVQKETAESVRLLERCVKLRPTLLRAWGCLAAIYEKLGNHSHALRALNECVKLERNPVMRKMFEQERAKLGG